MILIVSGFTEYFVNHALYTVTVAGMGLSKIMENLEKPEAMSLLGEPCSELLATKCINNGYRVTVHEGMATVATKKMTVWIPEERETEFKLLAEKCCSYRHLSFNSLRCTLTGKYVSLERL